MAKIAIVADDPALYRVSAWALIEDGHEVELIATEAAREVVQRLHPDVLVVNTGLPKEAKESFVEELKRLAFGSRVVDLVAPSRADSKIPSSQATVLKPVIPEDLAQTVKSIL